MNTKTVMTLSALFLAIIGIFLSFLPDEIMKYLNIEPSVITILFMNMLSALYLGFGILNWMAKGSIIGGIYNKPIVLGNLMHFGVGAIGFVKIIYTTETPSEIMIPLTALYIIFALLFASIFNKNPASVKK